MTELTLREMVQALRLARERYQGSSQALKDAEVAWRASIAGLIEGAKADALALGDAEIAVRAAVLEAYRATGERKPTPGVEVKDFTELVYDAAKAFEWAKAHSIALALDKKAFEALAKAGGIKEIVDIARVPKVNIATDLAKALDSAADSGPVAKAQINS